MTLTWNPPAQPPFLVLVSPQIPPNTGNIARLCAVTGCRLLLVEPLGFSLDDRQLKRAGLDYWRDVWLATYPDYAAYLADYPSVPRALFSARSERSLFSENFQPGHHLVFGSETEGLGSHILQGGSGVPLAIPMRSGQRSLNLSTAAGVATYEALRQLSGKVGPA